jgi:hypothetical protein
MISGLARSLPPAKTDDAALRMDHWISSPAHTPMGHTATSPSVPSPTTLYSLSLARQPYGTTLSSDKTSPRSRPRSPPSPSSGSHTSSSRITPARSHRTVQRLLSGDEGERRRAVQVVPSCLRERWGGLCRECVGCWARCGGEGSERGRVGGEGGGMVCGAVREWTDVGKIARYAADS